MIKMEIEGKITRKASNYIIVEAGNYQMVCNYNHANQLQE